jgi:hypothetical protein
MRRILILLLAIALPFKAVAAAVVPIVGSPNHAHAPHAAGAEHAHCDGAAAAVDADADTLHDHACPHLGMVMLVARVPALEAPRGTPRVAAEAQPAPPSVVLDILLPPPTPKS